MSPLHMPTAYEFDCGLVVLCGTALATGAIRLFGR